jgi:hypothetical protein
MVAADKQEEGGSLLCCTCELIRDKEQAPGTTLQVGYGLLQGLLQGQTP